APCGRRPVADQEGRGVRPRVTGRACGAVPGRAAARRGGAARRGSDRGASVERGGGSRSAPHRSGTGGALEAPLDGDREAGRLDQHRGVPTRGPEDAMRYLVALRENAEAIGAQRPEPATGAGAPVTT